eukprot:522484_1
MSHRKKKKYEQMTPEKESKQISQPPSHKRPKPPHNSPIKLCDELIETFDNESQDKVKTQWQKLFGKSKSIKDKDQNKNKKAKTDDKKKTKVKKTIDPKTKDEIYNVFIKVYNKIIPTLGARENDNNTFKPLTIDKQVAEEDISLNETKQVVTKGSAILRSLNKLVADYGLEEKKKMDEDTVSVAFVRRQLKEKHNNCIRKNDADNKYWCFDCKGNDPDWLHLLQMVMHLFVVVVKVIDFELNQHGTFLFIQEKSISKEKTSGDR